MITKWLFWIIFFWCGFFILLGIPEESLSLFAKYILLGVWGTLVYLFTKFLVTLSFKNKLKELLEEKELELTKEKEAFQNFTNASLESSEIHEDEDLSNDFVASEASETEIEPAEPEPPIPVEPWSEFIRNILKNRPFPETVETFKKFLENLLPNSSGILYMYNGNESELATIFEYGDTSYNKKIINPIECASFNQGDLVFHDFENPNLSGGCVHLGDFSKGVSFCTPIEGTEEHFGVLSVYTPEIQESDIPMWKFYLKLSAGLFGLFVATQKLHILFEKHNIRDISTGLFNARHMEESLIREIAAAKRHGHSIGVITIYPDATEYYIKTHGEKIAAQLLWEIGQRLPRYIRTEDIPCRYKDDVFCIILPGANQEIVMDRAEKIRKEIAGLEVVYGETILKSTLSIGVSMYPQNTKDPQKLIDSSVDALTEAFKKGQNRVISSTALNE